MCRRLWFLREFPLVCVCVFVCDCMSCVFSCVSACVCVCFCVFASYSVHMCVRVFFVSCFGVSL